MENETEDFWVDVNERLPDSSNIVIVTANDIVSKWVEALRYFDGAWLFPDGDEYPAIVSHWMPLPKPQGQS